MKEKIAIIGSGGFGTEVLAMIDRNLYEPVGFIDPHPPESLPLPVLGGDNLIPQLKDDNIVSSVVVAIGDRSRRAEVSAVARESGLSLPVLIHPSAVILSKYPIGEGTVIYPNVVVMNNCRIGRGVLINSGATIGHDGSIDDFSSIGPGANVAGNIHIGQEVLVGIGSCCREKITIGDRAIVGAGSVVLKDVPSDTTVYGVPAKPR